MNDFRSLSHTTWDCKYHLIWIPKYRKKVLFGSLRKYLGDVLRELVLQKESKIVDGFVHHRFINNPAPQYLNMIF